MSTTTPPCVKPGCIIPSGTFQDRVTLFTKSKLPVLNGCGTVCHPSIPIGLKPFLWLLKKFADNPHYNGIRVYFGCFPDNYPGDGPVPEEEKGQLTLLFVPTRAVAGYPTGADDTTKYYLLYKDEHHHLPAPGSVNADKDFVDTLTFFYRKSRLGKLNQDQNRPAGFSETLSLWYDMNSIRHVGADPGLIKHIECLKNYKPNPLVGLDVKLGAFIQNDLRGFSQYYYQLTLIFDLQQEHDLHGEPTGFGSVGVSNPLFSDSPSDTGIPCPPATNCPGGSSIGVSSLKAHQHAE
jgi:hypothetical protein